MNKKIFIIVLFSILLVGCRWDFNNEKNSEITNSNTVKVDKKAIAIKINNLKELNISKGDKITVAPDNISFEQLPNRQVSIIDTKSKYSKVVDNEFFYIVENEPILYINIDDGYVTVPVTYQGISVINYHYTIKDYGFIIIK